MFEAFQSIVQLGISVLFSGFSMLYNIPLLAFFFIGLLVISFAFFLFDQFRR